MLTKYSDIRAEATNTVEHSDARLHAVLWAVWTLFVVGFALVHWQFDLAANRVDFVIGLVIHTILAGLLGLIVMTIVEMRLNPERFTDAAGRGHDA